MRKNELKKLRKELGVKYNYKRFLSYRELLLLKRKPQNCYIEITVAWLEVGCVKLEAMLFKSEGEVKLSYDLYVKDNLESNDWIYFDSPKRKVKTSEIRMLEVLNQLVEENGLSYTECCFEKLEGQKIVKNK